MHLLPALVLVLVSPLWFYAVSDVAGNDVFEFRAYLTMVGVAGIGAWAAAQNAASFVAVLVLVALYIAVTRGRIRIRRSPQQYWSQAASESPEILRAKNHLGVEALKRNHLEYARDAFRSVFDGPGPYRTAEHAVATLNLVFVFAALCQFDEAEKIARDGLRLYSPFPQLLHSLAMIRARAGDYNEAGSLLGEAIALQPDEPQFFEARAEVSMYLGDLPQARIDKDHAARLRTLFHEQ